MILLKCLAAWFALSIVCAPVLIPILAKRFRRQRALMKLQEGRRI